MLPQTILTHLYVIFLREAKSLLHGRWKLSTIAQHGTPKESSHSHELPRLPGGPLPPLTPSLSRGLRSCASWQPAVAVFVLRNTISRAHPASLRSALCALLNLRKPGAEAHCARACERFLRLVVEISGPSRLSLCPVPAQILFPSPSEQRSPRRSDQDRQLAASSCDKARSTGYTKCCG